jgi:hypothetical protein
MRQSIKSRPYGLVAAIFVCAVIADLSTRPSLENYHVYETVCRFVPRLGPAVYRSIRRWRKVQGLLFRKPRLLQSEECLLRGRRQARLLRQGLEMLRREQGLLCRSSEVLHGRLGLLWSLEGCRYKGCRLLLGKGGYQAVQNC